MINHTLDTRSHNCYVKGPLSRTVTGLKAYTRQSKPLLTRKQKAKQLDWAESHCYWEDENWGAVVFSDESKFNLFGSDGRQWCWREPGQANNARYTKKLKHGGGNMMVWGCITRHGVGHLHCHSSYWKTLTHW
jgi:hypothetical protein